MADELELDLDLDNQQDINNKVEKRIKDLSEKVKTTSQERDELVKAKAEADTARANAEKERDFFSSFADSAGQYPEASNYKDAIKEKVMAGYSVEDATVSILAKEGKLQNYTPPVARTESPAGGSATTTMRNDMNKPLNEMTRDEKRAELMKAESEGGDVSNILRKNNNL